MTQQMQRLTARVEGTGATVRPASILTPARELGTSASSARAARRRAHRAERDGGWVPTVRVPRAVAAVAFAEPSDVHTDLLAAGLL
jgi:hypothetical protein